MKNLSVLLILLMSFINLFSQEQESTPEFRDIQALYERIDELQQTVENISNENSEYKNFIDFNQKAGKALTTGSFQEVAAFYESQASALQQSFSTLSATLIGILTIITGGGIFSNYRSERYGKRINEEELRKIKSIQRDMDSRVIGLEEYIDEMKIKAEEIKKNTEIFNLLSDGARLISNGAYGYAIGNYKKVLDLDPKNHEAYMNLGTCQTELGDLSAAEEVYLQALKLKPYEPDTLYFLGTVYSRRGNYEKAIVEYKKAIELDGTQFRIYYSLALAHNHLKDQKEETIFALLEALKCDPFLVNRNQMDSDFKNLKDDPRYKSILRPYTLPEDKT